MSDSHVSSFVWKPMSSYCSSLDKGDHSESDAKELLCADDAQ